jgi:hypothetical protein
MRSTCGASQKQQPLSRVIWIRRDKAARSSGVQAILAWFGSWSAYIQPPTPRTNHVVRLEVARPNLQADYAFFAPHLHDARSIFENAENAVFRNHAATQPGALQRIVSLAILGAAHEELVGL